MLHIQGKTKKGYEEMLCLPTFVSEMVHSSAQGKESDIL